MSAHAARNLSYSFFSSPLATRHFLPKTMVIPSEARDLLLLSSISAFNLELSSPPPSRSSTSPRLPINMHLPIHHHRHILPPLQKLLGAAHAGFACAGLDLTATSVRMPSPTAHEFQAAFFLDKLLLLAYSSPWVLTRFHTVAPASRWRFCFLDSATRPTESRIMLRSSDLECGSPAAAFLSDPYDSIFGKSQ